MLTKLIVRNLKRFDDVTIDLGESVVFIGPNNSGKTSALQALTLWSVGLRQWLSKRGGKASPKQRPGVALNRRDLYTVPTVSANQLWRQLHVRDVTSKGGKTVRTSNVRIDVVIEGITAGKSWTCGLEFDYQNEESLICRPIRLSGHEGDPVSKSKFTDIPDEAASVQIGYLPPMSGIAATEPKWEPGRINVLIGEGQTAQVIRNLCFQIYDQTPSQWDALAKHIRHLFNVSILPPRHISERGEIEMEYEEFGIRLDLSASGRGLQQTLLLLAHLYSHPNTVLLLDEPDAHLEILRQRQTYSLLNEVAAEQSSQIIAASHSEVVLNEAATRGTVIAFLGKPHRINDRGSQLLKSLTEIGWEDYYSAEQQGWVLYVENASDLAILQVLAEKLNHPAQKFLERPFVHYVATNLPQRARDHFFGLREARNDLVGIAIFDRLEKMLVYPA